MSSGTYRRVAAACTALGVVGAIAAAPAYADSPGASGDVHWSPISIAAAGDCTFPAPDVQGAPWSLQRVVLDQLWNISTGKNTTVAVIDTGVDNQNRQLQGKVVDGGNLLRDQSGKQADGTGLTDPVGHGTKVAGIIAAGHSDATGFVGLAPDAKIFSIRQNDNQGNGNVSTLMDAIGIAIKSKVDVINISQDVRGAGADSTVGSDGLTDAIRPLAAELKEAEDDGIVVVASSGNDGHEGPTYPAGLKTVLAVGASDRNNERAPFSQYGDQSDFPNLVAAPGVDMLSTVPKGGQCVDNGTSFSAPYVSAVAALLKSIHKDWTPAQIRARIEQTAQRTGHGPDKFIGWGVVDPVKAVQPVTDQAASPTPDAQVKLATVAIKAQPSGLAETQADRDRRTGTLVLGAGALVVAALAGGAIVVRDFRLRRES